MALKNDGWSETMRRTFFSIILLLAVLTSIPVMVTAKRPPTQAETYSVTFTGAINGVVDLKGLSGGRSLQGMAELEFVGNDWTWEGKDRQGTHEGALVIRIKKGTGDAEIIYDFDRAPIWNGKRWLYVPTYGLRGTGIWHGDEASFPGGTVTFGGTVDMYRIEASALTKKKGGVSLVYIYLTTLTVDTFEAEIVPIST
jgi:hypothetical protein